MVDGEGLRVRHGVSPPTASFRLRSRALLALTSLSIAAFAYGVLPALAAPVRGSEASEIKAQQRFEDGEPVAVVGLLRTGPDCLRDRTVEIRDVRPGVDDVIGRTKANGKGEWEIKFEKSWSDKTLYASVSQRFLNIPERDGYEINLTCDASSTPVGVPISARSESTLIFQIVRDPLEGMRVGLSGEVFSALTDCQGKRTIVISYPQKGGGEKTIATTTTRADGYWKQTGLPELNEIERVVVTVEPKFILSTTGKDLLFCGARTLTRFL